jgi:hypothetical protein
MQTAKLQDKQTQREIAGEGKGSPGVEGDGVDGFYD